MPFGTKSAWQYARWTWNIARNARITNPTGAELAAFVTFLKFIWNPIAATGTRPWMKDTFQERAVNPGDDYACNLDNEPAHVLVELLNIVGRDLKKIPITDAEAAQVDILIAATGERRYGTGPLYGGVIGSTVTVV